MGFTGLDYFVLVVFLLGNLALGTYLGRGQKTINEYFLAGKKVPMWAICLSIVATETSTLTFIGAPAIAYAGNLTFMQVAFGYMIGKLLVAVFLIPAYFRGEIQTAYQLLRMRFGRGVQTLSSLLFLVTRGLSDGVRLSATALVLAVITQMSDLSTMVIIGVITVIYTFYGGMIAVIWTDVIQLFIYIAGALVAFYLILNGVPGGWAEVSTLAAPDNKFQFIDLKVVLGNPYTILAGLVGGAFLTFATHGSDQMMVQRYLASGSKRDSQWALVLSGVIVFFQFLLFLVIGVMLYAFYKHYPLTQALERTDSIFPIFIVNQMPSGLSGLVVAAVFAAAMSTLSSCVNSLSSSTLNDFYRHFVPSASDSHYFRMSRFFTLIWGAILVMIGLAARNWGSVLQVGLTITSVTMGSVLGIFLLGLWSKRTGQAAGLVGMASGLAVMLIVHFSGRFAWTWYTLIGTTVTVVVGLLATTVLRRESRLTS